MKMYNIEFDIIKNIDKHHNIIRQIYEDRILLITSMRNLIFPIRFSSFMFLLSNNACIWKSGKCCEHIEVSNVKTEDNLFLVELKERDFDRIKVYDNNFRYRNIPEEAEIISYEQVKVIASLQEKSNIIIQTSEPEEYYM